MATDKLKSLINAEITDDLAERVNLYENIVREIFRDEIFRIEEIDKLIEKNEIASILVFIKKTVSDADGKIYRPFLNAVLETMSLDTEYDQLLETVRQSRKSLDISLHGVDTLENLIKLQSEHKELSDLAQIANKDDMDHMKAEIEDSKKIIGNRVNEIKDLESELQQTRKDLDKVLNKHKEVINTKDQTEQDLVSYLSMIELLINNLSEKFQQQNNELIQKSKITRATASQYIFEVDRLRKELDEIAIKYANIVEIYKRHVLENQNVFGNLNHPDVIIEFIKTKKITGAQLEKQVKEHTDLIDSQLQELDAILKAIVETREKLITT